MMRSRWPSVPLPPIERNLHKTSVQRARTEEWGQIRSAFWLEVTGEEPSLGDSEGYVFGFLKKLSRGAEFQALEQQIVGSGRYLGDFVRARFTGFDFRGGKNWAGMVSTLPIFTMALCSSASFALAKGDKRRAEYLDQLFEACLGRMIQTQVDGLGAVSAPLDEIPLLEIEQTGIWMAYGAEYLGPSKSSIRLGDVFQSIAARRIQHYQLDAFDQIRLIKQTPPNQTPADPCHLVTLRFLCDCVGHETPTSGLEEAQLPREAMQHYPVIRSELNRCLNAYLKKFG